MWKKQAINGQNTMKQQLTPNYLHVCAIKGREWREDKQSAKTI